MSQLAFTGGSMPGSTVDLSTHISTRKGSDQQASQRELDLEAKLAALQKDYVALHTAIFEGAQVHRHLCAPRLVRHGDFEIASEVFAVRYLPGDFFSLEESGDGVFLALGDISGKGLAAGMWATHLVGLVRIQTAASPDPQAIVTGVNGALCRMSGLAPLVSLFLARLNPDTGRLDYCSAGHPPALLSRADGQVELLSEGGLLLGVLPEASFATGCVELDSGDVLVVCSDGILESSNNAGQEFGYERLEAQLRGSRPLSADTLLFSVLGAVQDFAAASSLADDMSLVVLRRDTE